MRTARVLGQSPCRWVVARSKRPSAPGRTLRAAAPAGEGAGAPSAAPGPLHEAEPSGGAPSGGDAGAGASPGRADSGAVLHAVPTGGAVGNGSGPDPALAIPGYDSLSASQVVQRLEGLSAAELEDVRAHEAAHRQRRTILHRVEQLLAAAAPPGP